MKVSTDKIEGSQVVLDIEVDAEEMESAIKKAFHRLGAKTTVPGFRKGKAPPEMLERYFGREALVEDAVEHLLPEVYDRAIQEQEVDAIAQPQVEVLQIDPLSFKATVPVQPTIELDDYHQVKFEQETVVVTEEEEAEALEKIRYMQAPWTPMERPAKSDDLLAIDVEGTVEGEVVINEKEGWYQLSPDLPNALPGFAEQLEGAEKGEERVFTLTLPAEQGESGGKECSFKVLVNEIKEKKLAELDDDFAKSLGQGLETLDSVKEKIAADLRSRKEMEAKNNLEEKAIKALVDLARAEFPDIMVQNEIDHLMSEQERHFGDRHGLEDYLNRLKKTQEEFRNELRPMAERIVLRSLVLQRFAELEGVEVSAADIHAEIENMMQYASDEGVRRLFDSSSARESLRRNLFIRKAIDRLAEIATAGEASVALEKESVVSTAKEEEDENGDATE
jgi:trigger factor